MPLDGARLDCATMCYMERLVAGSEADVGVRELRQNLSVYLERVLQGTVFRVTDRGRPVALLVPMPSAATTAERLVASGRASAATVDLLALGRPRAATGRLLSEALQAVREDRV